MSVTTSDIVAELRRRAASSFWAWSGEAALYGRAADEIERLRAKVAAWEAFVRGRPTVEALRIWAIQAAEKPTHLDPPEPEVERLRPNGDRPTVVCLCGSTKFAETFERVRREETLAGRIVLDTGGIYGHRGDIDMAGPAKTRLDDLHLKKIDRADEIFVINCNGYLGESTRREITHARATGKAIRWLEEPYQER